MVKVYPDRKVTARDTTKSGKCTSREQNKCLGETRACAYTYPHGLGRIHRIQFIVRLLDRPTFTTPLFTSLLAHITRVSVGLIIHTLERRKLSPTRREEQLFIKGFFARCDMPCGNSKTAKF